MKKIIKAISLIELITTLVIITILMVTSIKTYSKLKIEYRRNEAVGKLIQLKNNLQQLALSKNTDITTIINDINSKKIQFTNEIDSYYNYSFKIEEKPLSYSLTATAVTDKSQSKDAGCTTMILKVTETQEDIKEPVLCWK